MDRFSISLKKKPPRGKKSKKEAVSKYDIQAIGEASATTSPPSEIVESLSENQLSELIFDYQPQERELLNSTFGQMSPGGNTPDFDISPSTLLNQVQHYFQEKNHPQLPMQETQSIDRRYQIIKESIATDKSLESPEKLNIQFGRKPHHAPKSR